MSAPQLHTVERGSGPLMLLLHGGSGSWTHWIHNIEPLSEEHRVIAVDLPGYGASFGVASEITREDYVSLLVRAAVELIPSGDAADLVGFSFGAALAGNLAAKLGDRVRRLSLLGPSGFGVPKGRMLNLRKMVGWDSPEAELRSVVAHNLGQLMLSFVPSPSDPAVDLQMANLRATRFDSRRVSLQQTLADDLVTYGGKVQVIWGSLDNLAFPSLERRVEIVRAADPAALIQIIEGAGHWVQYEKADEVNSLLAKFHS